jgi:hypothetical protein
MSRRSDREGIAPESLSRPMNERSWHAIRLADAALARREISKRDPSRRGTMCKAHELHAMAMQNARDERLDLETIP